MKANNGSGNLKERDEWETPINLFMALDSRSFGERRQMAFLCPVYDPQLLQLLELQPEQEPPPTEELNPLASSEKQANFENTFSAGVLHSGQEAVSFIWLIGRKSSNFEPHLEQTYSYIGTFLFSPCK